MADAQLIEYIGIIDAQIGHAAVSQEQFLEQIDLKIFMESVLTRAASFKACQCGLDQQVVNCIEIKDRAIYSRPFPHGMIQRHAAESAHSLTMKFVLLH